MNEQIKLINRYSNLNNHQKIDIDYLYQNRALIFDDVPSVKYQNILDNIFNNNYYDNVNSREKLNVIINLSIDNGANPNLSPVTSLFLKDNIDLLLDHPIRPLKLSHLLASIENFHTFTDDMDLISIRDSMIKKALDNGADFKYGMFNIELLYYHYDTILNHPINPMDLSDFLNHIVMKRELGSDEFIKQRLAKKAKLIEIYHEYASKGKGVDYSIIHEVEIITLKNLILNSVLDKNTLIELTLKASGLRYDEKRPYYKTEEVALQKKLLESLITDDIDINSFPLESLRIDTNNVQILELLLEKGINPAALAIHDFSYDDAVDVINLAAQYNSSIDVSSFIHASLADDMTEDDVLKLMLDHMNYNPEEILHADKIFKNVANYGPNFKKLLYTQFPNMEDKDAFKVLDWDGQTILHIIVQSDRIELLKYFLEKNKCDINSLNKSGQTPIFFAKSEDVANFLISHNADLNIRDINGRSWVYRVHSDLVEYLTKNNYLAIQDVSSLISNHISKGQYGKILKLYEYSQNAELDVHDTLINSIMISLENSIEPNKYQALTHLINNAGIEIPSKFTDLLTSVSDHHNSKEFSFINGVLHKLASYYIKLSEDMLIRNYGFVWNDFFRNYKVITEALNTLDNDFALQVLTLNGLRPEKVKEQFIVYRGMDINLEPDMIGSYFQVGHRAFSYPEGQKFLGFYVAKEWNENIGVMEYGGTYLSLNVNTALSYSNRRSEPSTLLQIRIAENKPLICGKHYLQYEVLQSTLKSEDIIAIYTIANNNTCTKIDNVYVNPYIEDQTKYVFQKGECVDSFYSYNHERLIEEQYTKLCNNKNSTLVEYTNYNHFISRYTEELFSIEREILYKDYFEDRLTFHDDLNYDYLNKDCNIDIECCG